MGTKTKSDKIIKKTTNIKEDTAKELVEASKFLGKTQGYIIEKLVTNYLDDLYEEEYKEKIEKIKLKQEERFKKKQKQNKNKK